ncbi:MAG: hypothetical protein A3G39_08365 [Deltaproteobacteria bacterium RIFCSPLOWO2_12_FULL_43_16]|nr:MAG: hypothetical protein A2Z89_10770 [Deltaproteobacteria bacterium GWA2_43_19]OGQ12202.1 MAG: hypothetical protein A3D30_01645 [Deltaproteobacteria bacterium RIFCSPHIGHO2_02_FULL_43_33]OGQ57497.1 MAG: hypothetical protein A3G39_08365 [Deltaproteobacteria bacterium RIFCSPLOWO2_12_FULL_43_16]HBR17858.1 Uma2 family endonuclease [Deltaproteobacteria bacterium]
MQTAVKIPENLKLTYEDYLLLPEGMRYEIIEGELFMTPSSRTIHQRLILRIARLIEDFVKEKGLGEVFIAPYDVILSKHDIVKPDIIFISKQRSGIITELNVQGSPDLAVEILSPSNKEIDLILKKKLYAAFGVKEYWVVDPANKYVKLFNLGKTGYMEAKTGNILKSFVLKGLEVDISGIFENVIKH